jgi:hypothetical protein
MVVLTLVNIIITLKSTCVLAILCSKLERKEKGYNSQTLQPTIPMLSLHSRVLSLKRKGGIHNIF